MRAFLLSLVMILFVAPPAMAEGTVYVPKALKTSKSASLNFLDQVSGGCLPQPNSAKNAAEVELRRSKFSVNPDLAWTLEVTFVGFDLPSVSGCVAAYSLEFWGIVVSDEVVTWAPKTRIIPMLIYSNRGVIAGPKAGFQKQIEDTSARLARDFTLVWLRQDAE